MKSLKLNPRFFTALVFLLAGMPVLVFSMASREKKAPILEDKRLEGVVQAPEFPEHLDWLNTEDSISLKDLRGKIILLDFWTYCCINCMHVLPELKKLEEKYPDELVVIGVHSAKFFNEKGTESIRQAIMRYEIKHPVLNDKDLEVWEQYGINAWPTLVLINPEGRIIGTQSGEDIFELFDGLIAQTIRYFDAKKSLDRKPLQLSLEEHKRPKTILSFPGKIRANADRKNLFISDSNHNRILITDFEGRVQDIIGSGKVGKKDGSFEAVELHHPQGTFLEGDLLYIADTENHLIREADLKTRKVRTLFGTGEKAREIGPRGIGTRVPLNSPWDLLAHQGKLYIAMAGSHQIYAADLKTSEIAPYAGSGREARVDGLLPQAALAQPSGITTNGIRLFFADSEVSSIRSADLDPKGKVETVVGEDLFEFGDKDGDYKTARLQHALGVEFDEKNNFLYVADTYNSKIKIVDPFKRTSQTFAGTGKHGLSDGELEKAEFFEPGGLSLAEGRLYVADTNNHQIRVIDLASKKVSTLTISGLDKIAKQTLNPFKGRVVEIPKKFFKAGKGSIDIRFKLPKGFHFNHDAPFHMEWRSEGLENVRFLGKTSTEDKPRESAPFQIPVEARRGEEVLVFDAVVYYCEDNSKICLFDHVRTQIPVEVKETGSSRIVVEVDILAKTSL